MFYYIIIYWCILYNTEVWVVKFKFFSLPLVVHTDQLLECLLGETHQTLQLQGNTCLLLVHPKLPDFQKTLQCTLQCLRLFCNKSENYKRSCTCWKVFHQWLLFVFHHCVEELTPAFVQNIREMLSTVFISTFLLVSLKYSCQSYSCLHLHKFKQGSDFSDV